MKSYSGIGSRATPPEVLETMRKIAHFLAKQGYTLRSGGAKGADTAFEEGCDRAGGKKEIFKAIDAEDWCREEVQRHLPKGYKWERMRPFVQDLLARNMKQVLGNNGDNPVEFVVCWTPLGTDDGGTGYAVRCAQTHNIPIYNIRNEDELEALRERFRDDQC